MPKEKAVPLLCVENLRHAEYYGMQEIFDDLYARSKRGEMFPCLLPLILKRENILLAYRNIKANTGSNTPGTDGLTIKDIGKLSSVEMVEKVRFIVTGSKHGYRPKPVRRKDIPKPYDPTKTRPLGIPCIWDRLVQQCIKQILDPICEAKFSENSFGFRPNRSVEHAIARVHGMVNHSQLCQVIEFDIKGFFDNVNHSKLIRQIWALGIQDKSLIYKIKRILKAPIRLQDGTMQIPQKGTPQGGILSPLLANVVLNELDHWIDSQWQDHPVIQRYTLDRGNKGIDRSNGYRAAHKTQLKEMHIIRYADDFRIFCRTRNEAIRIKAAVEQWLTERLKLDVSPEKTRIVNVRKKYSDFLGFKFKARRKGNKLVITSHISDKQLARKKEDLVEQAKHIPRPRPGKKEIDEIHLYNAMVTGIQNYYCLATNVSKDCTPLLRAVMAVLTNRLGTEKGLRLKRHGRPLTPYERQRYGATATIRFVAGSKEPIYPISYVQHKKPMQLRRDTCCYTPQGRMLIHNNLRINTDLMLRLMKQPAHGSVEFADNRISLFSAQWGKCGITGKDFQHTDEIHCHHKLPKEQGGTDEYSNLILVQGAVHKLIHAVEETTVVNLLRVLNLDPAQVAKVNSLRQIIGLTNI